ncbi:MAG TPA: hypothetical protein DCZ03_11945 [Gammaproteobacteria bacterium]|nr:hypothetical protein [Gammaproteobacteria bacterium]
MNIDWQAILLIATSPQAVASVVILATLVTLALSLISYFRFRYKQQQQKKEANLELPRFFRRIEPVQENKQEGEK